MVDLQLNSVRIDNTEWPQIKQIGTVFETILYIIVQTGRVEQGRQQPYSPQPGDDVESSKDRWLSRNGRIIGSLVGKEQDIFYSLDGAVIGEFNTDVADSPTSYTIFSPDDPAYDQPLCPSRVARKTKPTDFARIGTWEFAAPQEHVLYLHVPHSLQPDKTYVIHFDDDFLPEQTFVYQPVVTISEAVHVTHLGFCPDDSVKVGFLSCWMGSGDALNYPQDLVFHVLKHETDDIIYSGQLQLAKASHEPEAGIGYNSVGTSVYEMDFSSLTENGLYRLYVDRVGCSRPFKIDSDVWRHAFSVSAKGLFHQRSGIELGPPYTDFIRPRSFHPQDGMMIYHSNTPITGTNGGFEHGIEVDNFTNLIRGKTNTVIEEAWGGYMDAGDWDRRTQHLIVTRYLLELYDLFPAYYDTCSWNIPHFYEGLPDILEEALFNLSFYRQLQTEEGGVRGGIESEEHPRYGEASWQESLTVMAYAPDIWTTYIYSGVAAQAAFVLKVIKPDLSLLYRQSALRAMNWAEARWAEKDFPAEVLTARNLAAAELYNLTGEPQWHEIFKATFVFNAANDSSAHLSNNNPSISLSQIIISHSIYTSGQQDAAWSYLRSQRTGRDPIIITKCYEAITQSADRDADVGQATAFRWTQREDTPFGLGTMTAPDAVCLARATFLTRDERYLRAVIRACQPGAGANPSNVCYTTGLGHTWPQNPLHFDSRVTNQPAPVGITVLGPIDADVMGVKLFQDLVEPFCFPPAHQWPHAEAFWDVFWYPEICEYTVQIPMARNAYIWGFLAAYQRPKRGNV